jgi:hypothetical protein
MSALYAGILYLATAWVGMKTTYVRHFSPDGDWRAAELAGMFHRAGEYSGVPAPLLSALAYSESGYNSEAVGKVGEVSLMQLHPLGRGGRIYKRTCSRPSAKCDELAITLAAEELVRGYEACGTWGMAVGYYKSGRCKEGPLARYVVRVWGWFEGLT